MQTPKQYRQLTDLITEIIPNLPTPAYQEYLPAALGERVFPLNRLLEINTQGRAEIAKGSLRREDEVALAILTSRLLQAGLPIGMRTQEWLKNIGRRRDVFDALKSRFKAM